MIEDSELKEYLFPRLDLYYDYLIRKGTSKTNAHFFVEHAISVYICNYVDNKNKDPYKEGKRLFKKWKVESEYNIMDSI